MAMPGTLHREAVDLLVSMFNTGEIRRHVGYFNERVGRSLPEQVGLNTLAYEAITALDARGEVVAFFQSVQNDRPGRKADINALISKLGGTPVVISGPNLSSHDVTRVLTKPTTYKVTSECHSALNRFLEKHQGEQTPFRHIDIVAKLTSGVMAGAQKLAGRIQANAAQDPIRFTSLQDCEAHDDPKGNLTLYGEYMVLKRGCFLLRPFSTVMLSYSMNDIREKLSVPLRKSTTAFTEETYFALDADYVHGIKALKDVYSAAVTCMDPSVRLAMCSKYALEEGSPVTSVGLEALHTRLAETLGEIERLLSLLEQNVAPPEEFAGW